MVERIRLTSMKHIHGDDFNKQQTWRISRNLSLEGPS
jgi:hypothetical protein